jgi:hypothetical protein
MHLRQTASAGSSRRDDGDSGERASGRAGTRARAQGEQRIAGRVACVVVASAIVGILAMAIPPVWG